MSAKDQWVRRFSVDETAKHKNGFTIYKIVSVLFPLHSPEAVTTVSVWKRYSDVQTLHKIMHTLHTGLYLRGTFPPLPRHSYFKRFQPEVIEERAKTIKALLEFVAEHSLLFTSTDFVNFLQTGYPEPEGQSNSVINAIRTSLHLPIEETPPLEYQTDDEDARSPTHSAQLQETIPPLSVDETDFISQIPIYEAAEVEMRESPKNTKTDSFESLSSIESLDSDLFDELNKLSIKKSKPSVKKSVLPDLINFDAPSTSKFEDYHTMPCDRSDKTDSSDKIDRSYRINRSDKIDNNDSSDVSLSNYTSEMERSSSRVSLYSRKSALSLSNIECKTRTEDSYVFEAGYLLNLAARCEDMADYSRAFECYKSGIEKMLIGVQTDTDPQRRALIKEKTNKYLSYAEEIYKKHLCNVEQNLMPEEDANIMYKHIVPATMLQRPYDDLSIYNTLAVLGDAIMLVINRTDNKCYAMKVIKKVPNNLTEFDEYFLQRTSETRSPILPTIVPYMVPLHAFIETNNLIFLIVGCAPGEKLFDYIKNYAKSIPNTPSRCLNLENVFPKKSFDEENNLKMTEVDQNIRQNVVDKNKCVAETFDCKKCVDGDSLDNNKCVGEIESDSNKNSRSSVDELVLNSQKLLLNVDKVLTETVPSVEIENVVENRDVPSRNSIILSPPPRDVLPPSAICKWGAEILTALESLHNTGVICRDLNPKNILLGEGGQIILTYFYSYTGLEMSLSKIRQNSDINMYIAPELYINTIIDDKYECPENVCDFWSFGAIMYQLICGVPLSYYHRTLFSSHTILHLPDGLSVEEESLLTQLLTYEPSERLGAGKDGIEEIKKHPYFKNIDWQYIYDNWIVPD